MQIVLSLEPDHHVFDVFHAFGAIAHGLGGEVCVAARAVPVLEEFGLVADDKIVILGASHEEVPCHP